MRALDAYGIEEETDHYIEVWGRCDGQRLDPRTGLAVFGAPRVHEPRKTSMTVAKGIGYSPNRFADIVSRLAFFAPDATSVGREVTQDISAEGVKKRDVV
jgi:hypothetical protein